MNATKNDLEPFYLGGASRCATGGKSQQVVARFAPHHIIQGELAWHLQDEDGEKR